MTGVARPDTRKGYRPEDGYSIVCMIDFLGGVISTASSLIGGLGSVAGLLAFGVELKSFIDGKRHWSRGRIELAAVRHGWISRDGGGTYLLSELKLMNTGYAPIHLRQLFLYGMDYVPELMPDEMDICPLLAPGESMRFPVQPKEGEDTWLLATYFDSSDSRFLFVQSIAFSYIDSKKTEDGPLYSTFREWLAFLRHNRPRTISPKTVSDVNLQAGQTEPLRIKRRSRWSQRALLCLEEAIALSKPSTCIDLTPEGLSAHLAPTEILQDQQTDATQEPSAA